MRAPHLPVVLLCFGLSTTQAAAAPIETAGATQCEVSGFSIDPDPKGTNVRSAPRADAPIIGHLAPRVRVTPVETTGVTFKILGSKDGWLLIRDGSPPTDFTPRTPSSATSTSWPQIWSRRWSARRASAWSSMTRMRFALPPSTGV